MYDVIHFEALGAEGEHLRIETDAAITDSLLPPGHSAFITDLTLQEFMNQHPETELPAIITVKTHSKIPESWLHSEGVKKGIITRSAGYDHLEHLTEVANITSLREYCVPAVAQTAIKFLYAAAGMLNSYETLTGNFNRGAAPSFMELGRHRKATVFGVGKIGKMIHDLLLANGLDVYGVDIRGEELSKKYAGSVRFMTKEEAFKSSDIIINAMNLTNNPESQFYNNRYFSPELFSHAQKPLIFINVTRGEIAPEGTLLHLLESGKIIGLGLDVFTDESEFARSLNGTADPDGRFSASRRLVELALSKSANVYLQPHQGFNSDVAVLNKASEAIKHLVSWFKNSGERFDHQLPYY